MKYHLLRRLASNTAGLLDKEYTEFILVDERNSIDDFAL